MGYKIRVVIRKKPIKPSRPKPAKIKASSGRDVVKYRFRDVVAVPPEEFPFRF